jgi:hypothetical protein
MVEAQDTEWDELGLAHPSPSDGAGEFGTFQFVHYLGSFLDSLSDHSASSSYRNVTMTAAIRRSSGSRSLYITSTG